MHRLWFVGQAAATTWGGPKIATRHFLLDMRAGPVCHDPTYCDAPLVNNILRNVSQQHIALSHLLSLPKLFSNHDGERLFIFLEEYLFVIRESLKSHIKVV